MLRPMFDRIIVKKIDEQDTSTGGIALIGDGMKDPYERGIVKAVGPGRRSANDVLVTMNLKVGDRVLFPRGVGEKLKVDRDEFLLMFEGDVIGVIE